MFTFGVIYDDFTSLMVLMPYQIDRHLFMVFNLKQIKKCNQRKKKKRID